MTLPSPSAGLLVITLVFSALVPVALASRQAAGVVSDLSMSDDDAHAAFTNAVWYGSMRAPAAAKVFKAAAPHQRAALAGALGAAMMAYSRSDDFRRRYIEVWESKKPKPPAAGPKSAEELRAEQQAKFEKTIAEMRRNMEKAAPDMRQRIEQMMATMTAQHEAMDKNATMWAQLAATTKGGYEASVLRHQEALKKYESDHPRDPDGMIARRLREFLETSAAVDYSAALVEKEKKMRFADPALEKRSPGWKLCYRAGEEAVNAARGVAAAWLAQVEKARGSEH